MNRIVQKCDSTVNIVGLLLLLLLLAYYYYAGRVNLTFHLFSASLHGYGCYGDPAQ